MKRVMVNLEDPIGELAERKADKDRRSMSGYIALLVEKDLAQSGMMPGTAHSEILAAADEIGTERALAALRRAQRAKRSA